MAPRSAASPPSGGFTDPTMEKWVSVTWMPHTTLSQTSHVCCTVRSAHASLEGVQEDDDPIEWRVRIGVYGMAGLPLVPVYSHTVAAPVISRKRRTAPNNTSGPLRPTVAFATHDCHWECFVESAIRWRDLPRDAYLQFEILGRADVVVYEATMPFFSRYGRLATGLQKLELEPPSSVRKDRNRGLFSLAPRNERIDEPNDDDPLWNASRTLDQLERMDKRAKAARPSAVDNFGEIPSVPWLDAMLKERAKQILADSITEDNRNVLTDKARASLIIELPDFDIPIIYEETFYPIPQHGACGAVAPFELSVYRKEVASKKKVGHDPNEQFDPLELVQFLDYENEHDNPVEDKYRTLAHDLLRGLVDPALKPDREQRSRLASIIDSPSHHPTREEKDLLWRFRFSLVDNRRALTKFLLAVDWTVESEVVQAAELLEQWRKRSPIEVTDALKLLGKHVAFQTNLVRTYAIDTLSEAPDSELRLYLLQLVQALKYENIEGMDSTAPTPQVGANASPQSASGTNVSSLATFLIDRAARSVTLANYLYWYLKVELADPIHGARYREVFSALKGRLSDTMFSLTGIHESHVDDASPFKSIVESVSKLGSSIRGMELSVGERDRGSKKGLKKQLSIWDVLVEQDNFISGVLDIQRRCRESRGKKDAKEAELQSLLSKEGFGRSPDRPPVPLPSNPEIFVNGVNPGKSKMFKSALYPALLDFHVEARARHDKQDSGSSQSSKSETGKIYANVERRSSCKVIVKTGDDLRQDQLIIMMIQLMDRLLKRAALDLCLTPYSIIATSPNSGLVEFVDGAVPISQILSSFNGSIMQFFQSVAPQKGAKYEVRPDVMSTYVRSCAGYCVLTYLLAIGDRHLDNILLSANGALLHIDFGFIFGRDPKPLPPAFRLTREMVDGMGGVDSGEYRQFCSLACQAFNALRKSAGLVLNLLHLMSDAGIEDLSNNPAADAEGVIAKVEERFRLDLTDDQAERYFIGLINDCLAAIAPRVMDVFHSFSVARR